MIRVAVIALLVAVAATGCGAHATPNTQQQRQQLTNLRDMRQLQTAFNKASGEPRLVVLVSPT
jgi:hypothetical protein